MTRTHPRRSSFALARVVVLTQLLAGCGSSESDPGTTPKNVQAQVSENIATVVVVRWTTDEPTRGYVRYGPTDAMTLRTPVEDEPTREHSRLLLGLATESPCHFQVVSSSDAGAKRAPAAASGVEQIETGPLPTGMPSLTLRGERHDGYILVPVLGTTTAILILNSDGKIVWYYTDDRDLDFYRARLSRDGKALLYNAGSISGDPADNSELVRVSLDGSSTSSRAVPLLAHDFVEHADGTLAAIVVEYVDFEETSLRSDTIVEVDEDGEIETVWRATDCFDPAEVQGDDMEHGWTFANALDYDDTADAYYLGMRNFSSIAKIDRSSGECEWVLGGAASTFEFAAGSSRFLHQHQFDVHGNRILVMDNDGSLENESRVLEYELDFDAMVATEVWSYVANPRVYTFVLGEPTRLDDGDTFINWSAAGQMERVTPDGESLWQLNTSAGFAFGFHTLASSLYGGED